jgi:hypothetical protein
MADNKSAKRGKMARATSRPTMLPLGWSKCWALAMSGAAAADAADAALVVLLLLPLLVEVRRGPYCPPLTTTGGGE